MKRNKGIEVFSLLFLVVIFIVSFANCFIITGEMKSVMIVATSVLGGLIIALCIYVFGGTNDEKD